jgi:hypothetical protein
MWCLGLQSSTVAVGSFNDRSDLLGKMNNEAPPPTNEKKMPIINSGEHDNSDQWPAGIGLWKWGTKSESRNILTASATASLALLLLFLHQLTLTRPKTSTLSRPEHTGTPNIQYRRRIQAKWPSLGTEPLAGGEATVSEAPLQSRSLIEYFNDFDDISLFRLLESTSALLKSTRNCSRHYSHKH